MSELIDTFQDPELIELSQRYPVTQALGKLYDFWRSDQVRSEHGIEFFLKSPIEYAEVDTGLLSVLLGLCARQGQWVGMDVGLTPENLQNLRRLKNEGKLKQVPPELEPVIDAGFLRLPEHNGKVYLAPTQKFAEYVVTKANE